MEKTTDSHELESETKWLVASFVIQLTYSLSLMKFDFNVT